MRSEDVLLIVHKATHRAKTRVANMLVRFVVDSVDDSSGFQKLSVEALATEGIDEVEHMQPGGLTHHSLPGAEGVLLSLGGSREIVIALAAANRDARPNDLLDGETALYSIPHGIQVKLDAAGILHLGAPTGADFVALAALVLAELSKIQTAFDAHTHITTATVSTGAPGVLAAPASPIGTIPTVAATKTKAT